MEKNHKNQMFNLDVLEILADLQKALDRLDAIGASIASAHLSSCIDELHNKFKLDATKSAME